MIADLDDLKNVFASFKSLFDAYISKPVDSTHLVQELKSLALVA
jgi:hypothetical protein